MVQPGLGEQLGPRRDVLGRDLLQADDVSAGLGDLFSLLSQAPDAAGDVPGQQLQWLPGAYRHPRQSLAANPLQVAQV